VWASAIWPRTTPIIVNRSGGHTRFPQPGEPNFGTWRGETGAGVRYAQWRTIVIHVTNSKIKLHPSPFACVSMALRLDSIEIDDRGCGVYAAIRIELAS
jgi:hypothetical protein